MESTTFPDSVSFCSVSSLFDSAFGAGAGEKPKVKPLLAPVAPADVVLGSDTDGAPNEKPPLTAASAGGSAGAVVVVVPNGVVPVLSAPPVSPLEGAPTALKVNPPLLGAPVALNVNALLVVVVTPSPAFPPSSLSTLFSYPGLTVSQAMQTVTAISFPIMHDSHFHVSFFDANMVPHPLDAKVLSLPPAVSSAGEASSFSSSEKSDSSSSLYIQSIYHDTNASLLILPLMSLIFLIVRRCASSQYVVPIASINLPKSAFSTTPDVAIESNASIAFALSSSRSSLSSVSRESSPSLSSASLLYQTMNADLPMYPLLVGSSRSSCLSSSSPWKPSPISSSRFSSMLVVTLPSFSVSMVSKAWPARLASAVAGVMSTCTMSRLFEEI